MGPYGALIIPVIACIILAWKFHHQTKVWEFALPIIVSILCILGAKSLGEASVTHDTEYRGGWLKDARYYEDWDEWITQTCYRESCSGSGKNRSCTSIPYDCSYRQYHAEYWYGMDSNRKGHGITQASYNQFVKDWGVKPIEKELNRRFYRNDGDMWYVNWPQTDATFEPVTVATSYENRVQASDTVFSFVKVSEEEVASLNLFNYPAKTPLFNYPSVLGSCGKDTAAGNQRLQYHNAKLGRAKQLRMWILCYSSTDRVVGSMQEALWFGGNKNEVVLTVGLNEEGTVSWANAFSWTDHKEPVIEIRDSVLVGKAFDVVQTADLMAEKLEARFVRKKFADFSYITVNPPWWATGLAYFITLLVNLGLGYWIVMNDFKEGRESRPPQHRRGKSSRKLWARRVV